MVVVDGWGSRKTCLLPTVHILPKFMPTLGMPVKEFAEFTLPEGLGFIQSYQSGWTPSEEHAEVEGANPCWIMALHMGQFVNSQRYQKPELIYGVERMAAVYLLCQALVGGQWIISAHSIFVTTLWSQYYYYPHLQKRKCSTERAITYLFKFNSEGRLDMESRPRNSLILEAAFLTTWHKMRCLGPPTSSQSLRRNFCSGVADNNDLASRCLVYKKS